MTDFGRGEDPTRALFAMSDDDIERLIYWMSPDGAVSETEYVWEDADALLLTRLVAWRDRQRETSQ